MSFQAYEKLKVAKPSKSTNELSMRWHAIRLQEIQRQLSAMSDCSHSFCFEHSAVDQNSIYIPKTMLELPIEVVAAIAAFAWGEKMNLGQSKQADFSELFDFVSEFLSKYNYPTDRIVRAFLSQKELTIDEDYPISKYLNVFVLFHLQGKNRGKSVARRVKIKSPNLPCVLPAMV